MQTHVDVLEHSIQQTNQWLDDVAAYLDREDRGAAYQALRAVLIALRDRIGTDHAAHLSAQMPLLIRGIFYDGFHPADTPSRERTEGAFLEKVRHAASDRLGVSAEAAAIAVFRTLAERMDPGIIEKIAALFPQEMRGQLWPAVTTVRGERAPGAGHAHAR